MEEIKQEQETKESTIDLTEIHTKLDKLTNDNEILKKEIVNLKNTQVNVTPEVQPKKHEINYKL
ncbi:MAG: hypothetical protein H9W82_19000 [Lactobacillus sp.]|nr:hypothetical protein [Lactobacillus sp.]